MRSYAFLLGSLLFVGQLTLGTTVDYQLTLNTSALQGVSQPYQMDVRLIGGADNSVTLDEFSFGGGSGVFSPNGAPGVNISPGVIQFTDSAQNPGLEYFLSFYAGSLLQFNLTTTNNPPPNAQVADQITIAMLDTNGLYIPTSDSGGQDYFLQVGLTGSPLAVQIWASSATPPFSVVPISGPAIPEPSSIGLALLGVTLLIGFAGHNAPRTTNSAKDA